VLLSIFLLFITSWRLSLVMIAVVPILVGVTRVYGLFIRKFSKQYQDALAGASEVRRLGLVGWFKSPSGPYQPMQKHTGGARVAEQHPDCARFCGGSGMLLREREWS
jgi:ABC-type multidrug transport system fused ATPase/permease subunit